MENVMLEQAIALLLENTEEIRTTEEAELLSALGRVCAETVYAPRDIPPFDRSPLDGYALQSVHTQGATKERPAVFEVIGEVCAGGYFAAAAHVGQAVRIMTGAPIPEGCDCVVRQEHVALNADGRLQVPYALAAHEAYCFRGEDIARGIELVRAGEKLGAAHLGVLASVGLAKVKVRCLPRIVFCSTGDELTVPGEPLLPGKIYNSNFYTLAGRFHELGFVPVLLSGLPDDADAVAAKIREYAPETALFVTTGGVSVGKKDILHPAIRELGAERLFWKVGLKPGGPVLSYRYKNMLGIALSGNPFAALTTFELLVRPVLAKLSGRPELVCTAGEAVLADNFLKASPGRRFVRAVCREGKAHLPGGDASGMLLTAARCNAFVDIPAGTQALHRGDTVRMVYYR